VLDGFGETHLRGSLGIRYSPKKVEQQWALTVAAHTFQVPSHPAAHLSSSPVLLLAVMASSKRLIDAVSAVSKTSTTPYVCASCRFAVSTGSRQQTRHQSDLPFTEKIRRKIWGTDNPPGLKDPYGGPSFLERALAERRARSGQGRSTAKPGLSDTESRSQSRLESRHRAAVSQLSDDTKQHRDVTEQPKEYEPAENWESLKWVGHRGEYQYMDSTPADEYTP
jgi:hypothetical protein